MRIILHWFLRALAIMITAYLLPGIALKSFFVALVVAVVLGIFNTVLKPILIVLTLPITILTLGLFTLVINAGLIMLTAKVVDGFQVQNFWWALLFSLILSLVNAILHALEPSKNHHSANEE
ncbi:MAG: phage holin family protein [Candidatus Moranbacteria bacterium]|nr:phage holin family protein [Candidatus Moranbacteria bacterium]